MAKKKQDKKPINKLVRFTPKTGAQMIAENPDASPLDKALFAAVDGILVLEEIK